MEPYIFSLPSLENLKAYAKNTPGYMWPNLSPHAVVMEGALDDDQCDILIEYCMKIEGHKFPGCEAITREAPRPLSRHFIPIFDFSLEMNRQWWEFHLSHEAAAWFQTYEVGDSYAMHTDASPGQTRKLTTIALLTDPAEYEGGNLILMPYPEVYEIPKTRGTLCTFPPWVLHEVYPVTEGIRQTINLGFWGPPFK